MNEFFLFFLVILGVSILAYITGVLSKNYSQVDKLWSIVPFACAWTYVYLYGAQSPRTILVAILITFWGLRLSYNFSRRGGYTWPPWKGEEDYRWAVLKKKPELSNPLVWELFHFFFICVFQLSLIWAFSSPVLLLALESTSPLNATDYILATIMCILIVFETIADQQQYNFHEHKKKLIARNTALPPEYERGFVCRGLFALSRHPNFMCEVSIWIVVYLFSVFSVGWNWTGVGIVTLLALFHGSTNFTEKISVSKYPQYKEYQKAVPRLFPFFVVCKSRKTRSAFFKK